ncbi:MAG: amino acid adenylation domain-containing protein, partial [Cyanobacteriota bacterium]|nr:amino acid adenylation domain-containing protein [Cyanobacteriota bacterium]
MKIANEPLSLSEKLEAQSAEIPDRVAVSFGEQQLTYGELNSRATQLARYLQKLGVEPEVLVGVCLERSLDLVVGILGILKAGGAYMALDPSYPSERLSLMLEDTQAPLLLTQQHFVKALPPHNARAVLLDADREKIAEESQENLGQTVATDNLLYVTYTSGSTGKPKGIAMPQRPLLNLLEWQLQHYKLEEGMKTLQLASVNFDVSCQEIFSTWLSGGVLVMIPEALRKDAAGLSRLIANQGINRLFIPAVALQQLVEGFFVNEQFPTQLRYVIAGSEQLQITGAIADLFARLPHCTLHNEYGPSETHVATCFDLPQSPSNWPSRPPIGKPIANTQIYLLDEQMQPVPPGESGELYIGGAGLARGYLNRPETTAERFIPNPFAREKRDRLYKTGDLARYLPDENIEFLGRIDHQVKIRGFRIELGEIEAVLTQHPLVRETVVIAREDIPGDKRLVAYVVLSSKETFTVNELRQFLQQRLPDYTIPAAFVQLDALPLNPNRKVDRKALPIPTQMRPELKESYVAPRSSTEQKLTNIWQQVLGLELIGMDDDFLNLGGDSLLATQIINRIRETFQAEIALDSLLEESTIAKQARQLEKLHW